MQRPVPVGHEVGDRALVGEVQRCDQDPVVAGGGGDVVGGALPGGGVTYGKLGKLCDAAAELLDRLPPDQALRRRMSRFIDYLATKRGMADALRLVIASGANPFAQSRDRMLAALGQLLAAGDTAGTVRADVEAGDVLASLSGISLAASERAQADRLLDLLMDGLRQHATG
ncbi:hypothetical protein [Micromonospora vulcania]|uniref:Transcriptional regulator SbtR-like C-terminal domain-containing protein n=1 Tax=Micromonospora vulcania TaxID=1441873 RepID=A0ABW1GYG6_9ACTN